MSKKQFLDELGLKQYNELIQAEIDEHIDDTEVHVTSSDKSKISSAYSHSQSSHSPSNAERNTIVTIKKNGTALTPDSSRAVNITVPTTASEIGAASSSHTHDDRYYTESEMDTKLSAKAPISHGNHVPTTETANSARFLRNDNTWQTVTPANIGAAASSHGTHVSYSTTTPSMDGAGSVGTTTTVARSDHQHPTDTSRASQSDLTSHTGNSTVHVTASEKSTWNSILSSAKTYADQKIANLVGSAPTTLDTLEEVAEAIQEHQSVTDALDAAIGNKANASDLTSHTGNKSNPHGVTKSQVGLGNVPNVTTNNQTPTYSDTTTLATLSSGETVSTAFAKIKLAITNLINHLNNKSNPHGVTKSQVGLGNVDNTSDANKPISTATQTALNTLETELDGSIKGLSVSGKVITYTRNDGTTGTITTQDTNTTYSAMTGATSSAAGKIGLVPAPAAGKQTSFLRGDGTWVVPTNTTYSAATTSANGLMSASDKTKLDGIATGAQVNQNAFSNVVVGSTTVAADSATDTLTLVGSNVTLTPDATNDKVTIGITKANVTSALGYTPPTTNTTYSVATSSANGLMSSTDKKRIDSLVGSYALGGMNGKTVADLQSALKTWLATYYNIANATCNFVGGSNWVTLWNAGDTSTTITEGVLWTVRVIGMYTTSAYAQLEVSTYNSAIAYCITLSNNSWQPVRKIAFDSDLSAKQNTITGAGTTITSSNLTASRALISNSSGKVAVSDVTSTELGYLDGVTSNVQTQLDKKSSSTHKHTVSHTPVGSVKSTFTGSAVTSGASSGTTSVYSITGVGSVPSLTASVTNKCLTFSFSAGSVPTRSSVTLPSTGHTHSVTAAGSVSSAFTGTAATLTSSAPT